MISIKNIFLGKRKINWQLVISGLSLLISSLLYYHLTTTYQEDKSFSEKEVILKITEKLSKARELMGVNLETETLDTNTSIANLNLAKRYIYECELLKEDYPMCQNFWGLYYYSLNEFEVASQKFRDAIKLEPEDPYTHYNLGLALENLDKKQEAICAYFTAISTAILYEPEFVKILDAKIAALLSRMKQTNKMDCSI